MSSDVARRPVVEVARRLRQVRGHPGGEDAGQRSGLFQVHVRDARVGKRGADHGKVQQLREGDVARISASAGDQAGVLQAAQA
jgi:hypothetical protein